MRISDWSSDVCSSDLADRHAPPRPAQSLRATQGAHPRPGHHGSLDARVHRLARPARGRTAAAAGHDAGQLHRPGRGAGQGCVMATTSDASAFPGGDGSAKGCVEIGGPDLDRSLDFYLLLGFELIGRSEGVTVVYW